MNLKELIKAYSGKLADKMKTDRRVELIVYGALILLVLLLFVSSTKGSEKANVNTEAASVMQPETAENYADVETRLEEILSCIRGAGKIKVMITYDTGTQIVPAMSTNAQTNTSETTSESSSTLNESQTESKEPVTISQSGSNQVIVLTERMPEIRGVIVIAQGAADIAVRMKLEDAVETVLGVDASCINVFEMSSNYYNSEE